MKKIKRIKFENIFTIIAMVFGVDRLLTLIEINGVSTDTTIEIVIYSLAIIGIRYIAKDLRLNPTNWLLDK